MDSFTVPEGYKLVPVTPRRRGKQSLLEMKHPSELTSAQLNQIRWRKNNKERLRQYNFEYYHAKRKIKNSV
jgi:hypothetical protein